MTIFQGVFSTDSMVQSQFMKDCVRDNLSSASDDGDLVLAHDAGHFFLTNWDSEAYAEPAWKISDCGSVCTVPDDQLTSINGLRLSRQEQLKDFADQTPTTLGPKFALFRSSFACAQYHPHNWQLTLPTDAIGVRPVYNVIQDDLIFFTSVLGILETTPQISQEFSLEGLGILCKTQPTT